MKANNDNARPDDEEAIRAVTDQVGRLATAGMVVTLDPDDAEEMAAFEEDALSAEEALESRFDDEAEGA